MPYLVMHIRYSNNTLPHFLTLVSKDRANLLGFLNFQNFIDMPYQWEVQASFLSCGLSAKRQNLASKSILVQRECSKYLEKKQCNIGGETCCVDVY